MTRAKIIATGAYAPKKVLTNKDLEKLVDTTDEWIMERTGIRERHVAEHDESAADLAYHASKKALKDAGIKAKDLDMIVLATVTPDYAFPSTACVLQDMLGAKDAFAFDINAACSGFIYGLSVADKYIRTGSATNVLVVGAEVLTKFVDWTDRSTCVLFGDGAGAAVLTATKEHKGITYTQLHSDGSQGKIIYIPAGGSRIPASIDTIEQRQHLIKMRGNELFKVAVKSLEQVALATLEKNNITADDIAMLIPHQANLRIIQATAQRIGLPMEKVYINLDRYGNTSAASIPIAFDEALRKGLIGPGDLVMLEAFGAGLTWASALIKL